MRAIEEAKCARGLDHELWLAIPALASAYYYAGSFDLAIEEYRRALAYSPLSEGTRAELALALHSVGGRFDAESTRLAKEVLQHRELAPAHIVLGELALESNNVRDALDHASKAAVLAPRNASAQLILGDALQVAAQLEEAKEVWKEALRLSKVTPTFGMATARLRQVADALEHNKLPTARNARAVLRVRRDARSRPMAPVAQRTSPDNNLDMLIQ